MTPSAPAATVFRTARVLAHSPESVYGAFADAALLARWWGPRGFTSTFETFDFRPGGDWTFVMHGPDGGDYPNASVFEALEPAARVVIRHVSPPHFTLTVTLDARPDGGTDLTWSQAFADPRVAAQLQSLVERANEENLDRLCGVLGGDGPS